MNDLGKTASGAPELTAEEIESRQALVERVLASVHFSRAARLSAFLRFVCDRALNAPAEEISEHVVGVEVFGRRATYNPGEDNIVRSNARLLRQRLDAYFEAEGRDEPVRITIPKGAYVAVFESRQAERLVENAFMEAAVAPTPPSRRRWLFSAVGSMALAAGGYAAVRLVRPDSASSRMWKAIFDGGRNTLVVPGDAGLVLAQDLTRQKVSLTDYIRGDYVSKLTAPEGMSEDMLRRIARRRYTGTADVELAFRLAQRQEMRSRKVTVRYARDLGFGELRDSNAILLGAPHSNPWLELFQNQMDFTLDLDLEKGEFVVRNKSPRRGEQSEYQTKLADPRHPVWAVLSFLPNIDGAGHVLILAGASVAGTDAAAEFLMSGTALDHFLAQAPERGRISHFNVLLESNAVAGNSTPGRPIAWRFR